jgi:signal transduction histidine kinase
VRPAAARLTRPLLLGAFGLVTALLVALQVVDHLEARQTADGLVLIQNDVMGSVEQVHRVESDIQRERILISRHIFELRYSDMLSLEHQIAIIRRDYLEVAGAHSQVAATPEASALWLHLLSDALSLHDAAVPAIELSRENRNDDAAKEVVALDPVFERIHDEAVKLVAINSATADDTVSAVARRQSEGTRLRLALAIGVLAIIAATGVLATRAIVRAQAELERGRVALEDRNRELDAFAGRVAHDLRGPLTTLSLSASVLAERATPDAAATTAIMKRGIAQMDQLVEDLLELSRAGAVPGAVAGIDEVANAVARDLAPQVTGAGGELKLEVEPAKVSCSDGLLRQVLWNLGENAVKYRRPDVRMVIEISGRVRRERYELRIKDNGIGMSADDARHVFEPFFRSAEARSLPGTGLGLAIVRRIVEAVGGTVAVASTSGRGTTFDLTLPIAST